MREKSFAAAAHELGYTASAVSQQMRSLERATGLELFERLSRSIRPTAAAQNLARAGQQAVLSLRSVEHDAQALAEGYRGHITIGSFRTASANILPPAFAAFRHARVSVTIDLVEGEPEDLLDDLRSGAIDLALVYENELNPQQWPIELTQVPLLTEQRLLLMPAAQRPVSGQIRLAELRDLTWVASAPSPSLMSYCSTEGFAPQVAFRTNDYYSICAFVRAGIGIALVPVMGHYLTTELPAVALSPAPPRRYVSILHRRTNTSPLLRPVIQELQRAAASVSTRDESGDSTNGD